MMHANTAPRRAPDLDPGALFDRVTARIRTGSTAAGMSELFTELDGLRVAQTADQWRATIARAISHPLRELIHKDPMARHAFEKPRGYAGDAALIDYIYGLRELGAISELGRQLHLFCGGRSTIRAVRHRRDVLAHSLDRLADATGGDARVLSVACGHFREGDRSAAIRTEFAREVVGLDSDEDSLAVARRSHPRLFTPACMSVRRLLTSRVDLGEFDFVYSAGLYDYLEDRFAARLTRVLFDQLRPRGSLLLCNFLDTTPDVGFMEAFMGWNLIYRDRARIESLLREIPEDQIGDLRYSVDPFRSIGYLEVRRM